MNILKPIKGSQTVYFLLSTFQKVSKEHKTKKGKIIAVAATMLLYILVTIICLAVVWILINTAVRLLSTP